MDATEHTDSGGYHTADGHKKISNLPRKVAKYLLGRVLFEPTVFGWLGFLRFYWEKAVHWLVWLLNFFNQLRTWLKWVKTMVIVR